MRQCYNGGSLFCRLIACFFFSFLFINSMAQPVLTFSSKISGLTSPIDIVNAGDHSNRLFVVQQGGVIKVFDQSYAPLGDFLTVSGISSGGERGLLSLAFHPDYATNGFFFVYYTNTAGDVEIARYHTPAGTPNQADPASKQVLLTIPHPGETNHNGGKLNFGSDGYLYFATGDGGGGGDVPNNAQNGNVLLGKMLRINVSTGASAPFYTIPADNPFQTSGDNILDEIWAVGLRNPFRWSFDRLTHDMWIADVGQGAWEEVNMRTAGATGNINYGWHCFEGTHTYPGSTGCPLTDDFGAYIPPLLDYPHNNQDGGFAIIGGYVYRGTVNPAMYGYYIFADEVSGNVWLLPPNGGAADTLRYSGAVSNISGFGESEDGELYAISLNGVAYNVTATATGGLPVKLISFDGTAKAGYNDLNWVAADEQQFRRYEVEYSTDGVQFLQAGVVNATNQGNYAFKHVIAASSSLYYRLKLVDLDGKWVYSKVILVGTGNGRKNAVAPTLISNRVLSMHLESGFSLLQLISMDGKIMYQAPLANTVGQLNIQLPRLPAGQYLVRLQGTQKQFLQRVVLQ